MTKTQLAKQTMQAAWYDQSDVAAAHEAQDSGQLIGKVIVEIV